MFKNKTAVATLSVLTAQIIFGFSFMFTKIALKYASPITIIADRYILAFIGLSLVMLITKQKIRYNKNLWKLVLMSMFQPVLYFIFEGYGIAMTTSSFSSVMISLIPVVSMLSGIFILKEYPSPLQYVFTGMSVCGVAVMAFAGKQQGTVTIAGILLLLGAVLCAVGYNIVSRKISSEFSALERTYAMSAIGVVSFGLMSLIENIQNPINVVYAFGVPSYTLCILYIGIASSVLAFLFLNYANTYLPIAKTTVFSNVTTVVSVAAGVIFLKEDFSVNTAISSIMIIVGVWGVQMLSVKTKK